MFLGGTTLFNTASSTNLVLRQAEPFKLEQARTLSAKIIAVSGERPELFALIASGLLLGLFLLVSLAALSYGAVIWSAGEQSGPANPKKRISFASALRASRIFFWRILGLQLVVSFVLAVIFLILILPVAFLFEAEAIGRAMILLLLAAAIFIPAAVVFGFMHLYGPIFIVLFDRKIGEAVSLSFNLIRKKLKESLILAAFLLGLSLLFILVLIFSIILFSIPVAILLWFVVRLEFILAAEVLSVSSLIAAAVFAAAMQAGFAVFQSISWVLAVSEMVRTIKTEKEERALAVEPA